MVVEQNECKAKSCEKYAECAPEFICSIKVEGFPGLDVFKPGYWDSINPDGPIFIESREQLKKECDANGLYAKCLKDGYGRKFKGERIIG